MIFDPQERKTGKHRTLPESSKFTASLPDVIVSRELAPGSVPTFSSRAQTTRGTMTVGPLFTKNFRLMCALLTCI